YDDIDAYNRFYGGADLRNEKINSLKGGFRILQLMETGYDFNFNYTLSSVQNPIVENLVYHPYYLEIHLVNSDRSAIRHNYSIKMNKNFIINEENRITVDGGLNGNMGKNVNYIDYVSQHRSTFSYNQNILMTYSYS